MLDHADPAQRHGEEVVELHARGIGRLEGMDGGVVADVGLGAAGARLEQQGVALGPELVELLGWIPDVTGAYPPAWSTVCCRVSWYKAYLMA